MSGKIRLVENATDTQTRPTMSHRWLIFLAIVLVVVVLLGLFLLSGSTALSAAFYPGGCNHQVCIPWIDSGSDCFFDTGTHLQSAGIFTRAKGQCFGIQYSCGLFYRHGNLAS